MFFKSKVAHFKRKGGSISLYKWLSQRRIFSKHEFIWNGEDSHGFDMPSGVYLYRIQDDDEYVSSKMILLK